MSISGGVNFGDYGFNFNQNFTNSMANTVSFAGGMNGLFGNNSYSNGFDMTPFTGNNNYSNGFDMTPFTGNTNPVSTNNASVPGAQNTVGPNVMGMVKALASALEDDNEDAAEKLLEGLSPTQIAQLETAYDQISQKRGALREDVRGCFRKGFNFNFCDKSEDEMIKILDKGVKGNLYIACNALHDALEADNEDRSYEILKSLNPQQRVMMEEEYDRTFGDGAMGTLRKDIKDHHWSRIFNWGHEASSDTMIELIDDAQKNIFMGRLTH